MYYAVQRWNPSIARANDLDGGAQVRAGTSQAAAELPSCTAQHYFCIYPAGCLGWGRGGGLQNSAYSMLLKKLIQILEHLQLASYTAYS